MKLRQITLEFNSGREPLVIYVTEENYGGDGPYCENSRVWFEFWSRKIAQSELHMPRYKKVDVPHVLTVKFTDLGMHMIDSMEVPVPLSEEEYASGALTGNRIWKEAGDRGLDWKFDSYTIQSDSDFDPIPLPPPRGER